MQLSDSPLVAAPMAGGPSTPDLVVAASAAGAFGFLAAGYRSPDQLVVDIETVRARTESFGVNLFVPDPGGFDRRPVLDYRERLSPEAQRLGVELPEPPWTDDDGWRDKVELLLSEPVPWVSFTFGLPGTGLVDRLQEAGTQVAVTVTDADEARAADAQGVELLVVQSAAAGGHRGSFDQSAAPSDLALPDLVRSVRAVTSLPLVAAGGVGTAHDVRTVLGAGALAVQVGTALLLTDEAGTGATHRSALQDPAYDETVVTRAFTGRPARALRNGFIDRHDHEAPVGYPAVHHLTRPIRSRAAATGDPDVLHLWAGTGHRHATSGPAADVLAALEP
ncbi:nitronate monooxygenase [Nocardioides terrisoli]|uniref:nitronate monooxygenase n=1 Tax=Nocardioides terrisoli TaxID=3388267 RepID=UPI00287B6244|nr:nitronate monooxygenase [Nocardioides marmorisolisilvae]